MPVALDMFFSAPYGIRQIGWSERIIVNQVNLDLAFTEVTRAAGYLKKRVFMLGEGVTNTYNRLTLLQTGPPPISGQRRNVFIIAGLAALLKNNGVPYYNPGLIGFPTDFGDTVFMNRLSTDSGVTPQYIRSMWLAGFPDNDQQAYFTSLGAGNARVAWTQWQALVVGGGYCIQVEDRSAGNPAKVCGAIVLGTPTQYTVVGHGFLQGQRVVATGWRATSGGDVPKGIYKVSVIDANTITLQNSRPPVNVSALGVFRLLSYQFPVIASLADRGFTNKKHGRPFDLLPGRRRTLRTSRS
jgi:hypothetical protein